MNPDEIGNLAARLAEKWAHTLELLKAQEAAERAEQIEYAERYMLGPGTLSDENRATIARLREEKS